MRKIAFFVNVWSVLILMGCQSGSEYASYESDSVEPTSTAALEESEQGAESIERKLIKEGQITFEVLDPQDARVRIIKVLNKYKGYLASDNQYKGTGRIDYTLVLRIPAIHFDVLLQEITEGIEQFDQKDIQMKDVTEEYLDVQARLKTKKALELRYLELLKRANKVSEMLEIEKQIGDLRATIESIEGRLKYLDNKVSYATLQVTYYVRVSDSRSFGFQFKDGFKNGWESLIMFFVGLVNIWPFLFIGIGLIYGIRRWSRRRKQRE